MSELVAVGVDAGGTSTHVVVSVGGVIVGEAMQSGANATTLGVAAAAAVMLDAIDEALGPRLPHAIVVGAAGAARGATETALETLIGEGYPLARVQVGDDAFIAFRAAIPSGPGIVLIAGTGSIAYAENEKRSVRIGGYGTIVGDEGSAFAIGMAAVKLYARVLDGRAPEDETTALVARALEAPDRDAFIAAIYDAPLNPATIAALAPSIVAFAGKGNRAATKIVQQAGSDLGDLIRSAARAVDLLDASPSIALRGGLFRENTLLSFLLETRIAGDIAGAVIVRGGDSAAIGALRLAETLAFR